MSSPSISLTARSTTVKSNMVAKVALFFAGLLVSAAAFAAGGGALQQADTDLNDRGSLQRGAKLYLNYCAGCHSLKYLRYSRMATDLGLTEDEVMENLVFTDAKFGDHIETAMPAAGATEWFGNAPPDLSVISRVRGADWLYTYLKSFYLDETSALGWNNSLFPNVAMPNPLWEMQGLQHAEYGAADATGARAITGLTVTQPGTMDAKEFDQSVRDITAFLEYAGEPAILKRPGIGVWVILFLAVFTFFAWLLNREYWRDVH